MRPESRSTTRHAAVRDFSPPWLVTGVVEFAREAPVGRRVAIVTGTLLALLSLVPASASALSVARAELRSGALRVEGGGAARGAQVRVTTTPTTSTASGTADSSGAYRIEASGFRSDTCQITVSDGVTANAQATLSGCTPTTSTLPPTTSPPPSSSTCTLNPQAPATGNVGTLVTFYFTTTGCRTSQKPISCKVVSGQSPPGLTLFTQGVGSCGLTGRATTEGVFRFTLQVTDQTGARDSEIYQITIDPPRPLVITNQSDALSPGTVGQSYCCGNLFADGGVPGYTWSLRAGQLPPGLQLSASPGRITGTPTTRGTFSFLVRVADSRDAFAERAFSITIG